MSSYRHLEPPLAASLIAYRGMSEGGGRAGATEFRYKAMKSESRMEDGIAASAPVAAKADRAYNKAINSDAYEGDLIQDVENGKAKIETLNKADLPNELQNLSSDALKAEVGRRIADRNARKGKISGALEESARRLYCRVPWQIARRRTQTVSIPWSAQPSSRKLPVRV